jgi:hypothetical protein
VRRGDELLRVRSFVLSDVGTGLFGARTDRLRHVADCLLCCSALYSLGSEMSATAPSAISHSSETPIQRLQRICEEVNALWAPHLEQAKLAMREARGYYTVPEPGASNASRGLGHGKGLTLSL